jgi:hypothetical protein
MKNISLLRLTTKIACAILWPNHTKNSNSMKTQYERLMKASLVKKGWDTAVKVAEKLTQNGYPTSPQSITNWKTRGLSSEAILRCSRIIGCHPLWLESGEGEMAGATNYADKCETDLIASLMTEEQRDAWLAIGRLLNKNRRPT